MDMLYKHHREVANIWILIIAIILFTIPCAPIFAALFVCILFSLEPGTGIDVGNCSPSHPQQIQEIAHFQLPANANLLESHCSGMQGWGAYAKFEMYPADLNSFIASTRVKSPLSSTERPHFVMLSSVVDDLDSYLYGKYQQNEFLQEILIDTSNPELYIVYVSVLGG